MSAKNALLIVSNPKQISRILPSIQKKVKNKLYVQLLSALTEPFGNFYTNNFTSWPKYSPAIYDIYSQAATHCRNLDVRVLLSGLKYRNLSKIQTNHNIDLIIFDKSHSASDIDTFIKAKVATATKECKVLTLDSGIFDNLDDNSADEYMADHVVAGGTFDRLHIAHKLLLSETALRSKAVVTIGVTEEILAKILWELIEDISVRIDKVRDFLTDICPELSINVVPIYDPFGPAGTDPTMGVIVVSEETVRGGEKVNEIRQQKKIAALKIIPIKLIDEPYPNPVEETKISSSTARIRLLGTVLQPIPPNPNIPSRPYVIGLTGGVASGKSGVAKWLSPLGAEIINCDIVGHHVYEPDKPCYKALVENFGKEIVASDGTINRRALGNIVFKNPDKLKLLNSLVWPAISDEINKIIRNSTSKVVVVEAAVLIQAKWQNLCHEVWTTLVPRSESISRLKSRNGLTEEQASARIDSQPSNTAYVKSAHVVFCPLWEEKYTKLQVEKAWKGLQERLL